LRQTAGKSKDRGHATKRFDVTFSVGA